MDDDTISLVAAHLASSLIATGRYGLQGIATNDAEVVTDVWSAVRNAVKNAADKE